MAIDITNVKRLTFGVNFLGEDGGKEVENLWRSRFADREAFLVTAAPETSPKEIFDQFCALLEQHEQTQLVGKACLLTYFVDYTAELPKTAETAIWGMRKRLEKDFGCNVQTVIQFAYVGRRGDNAEKQRANIQKALTNNGKMQTYENYRLLMVGKSVLKNSVDYNWKAAVLYVDLLRRCQDVGGYLPVAGALGRNDIGFLRYGEFDEVRYNTLLSRQKQISDQLADAKPDDLRALVEEKRKTLIEEIDRRYVIDGALHPQHPDMIVPERRGWFGPDPRHEAERGKNETYNAAVKATRAAVESTGTRIHTEIQAFFDTHIQQAPEILEDFFQKSNAGIKLKTDPMAMQTALYMQPYSVPSSMPKLAFKYSLQGVQQEIQSYLEYIKMVSIADGLKQFAAALHSAYEAIPTEELTQQRKDLEKEQGTIAIKIAKTHSAQEFCNYVAQNYPPESIFDINNEMNVNSQKHLLSRYAYAQMADSAANLGVIRVHSINDQMSGVVSYDDAPLKALMVECVECKDWVLDYYLPEEQDEFAF